MDTVQGVDYTAATPRMYADAWVVTGAELSVKNLGTSRDNRYVYSSCFPCTLVFAAGPNAKPPGPNGPANSTMRRTFNAQAHMRYETFLSSVSWAVYTALLAMARDGCQVAMVARLSCGLYAANHDDAINRDFPGMVNALLMIGGPSGQPPLGRFFKRVVIVMLE